MDSDRAYVLGFGTLALGLFLGYHWSPDYLEFISNGNNFLWIVGFAIGILIMFSIIDVVLEKRRLIKSKQTGGKK